MWTTGGLKGGGRKRDQVVEVKKKGGKEASTALPVPPPLPFKKKTRGVPSMFTKPVSLVVSSVSDGGQSWCFAKSGEYVNQQHPTARGFGLDVAEVIEEEAGDLGIVTLAYLDQSRSWSE